MKRARQSVLLVLLVAGVLVPGAVAAQAASLGGVAGSQLGADGVVIASCTTAGVSVSYTNTYSAVQARFNTTSVAFSGLGAGCDGATLTVTLADGSGGVLASGSAVVEFGSANVAYGQADSRRVQHVAVVVAM